jgi:hypothetical protein
MIQAQGRMPEVCESRAWAPRMRWMVESFSHTFGMRPATGMFAWQGPVVPAAPLRGFASPPAHISAPSGSPGQDRPARFRETDSAHKTVTLLRESQ